MSLGRDLYKTRLCHLHQRGNCQRQSCSFAHGEAELRRFANAVVNNGRRDLRAGDLRDRLPRRPSSHSKRLSPGKDSRVHYDKGRSISRSPLRERSSRSASPPNSGPHKRDKKKFRLDDHEANISCGISGRQREHPTNGSPKHDVQSSTPDPKILLEEELREAREQVLSLTERAQQLESLLAEKTKDVHDLTTKNSDLDQKLQKHRDDYKSVSSKLDRFIKIYQRHSKAEEEMKRTREKLLKLVEETPSCGEDSDIIRCSSHGEDSDVNILSDVETKPIDSAREADDHRIAAAPVNDYYNIERNVIVEAPPKLRSKHLNGKVWRWGSNGSIPSTALAAHAEDEIIDTYDDALPVANSRKTYTNGHSNGFNSRAPYGEYAGDDENVDVEALDDYSGNQ